MCNYVCNKHKCLLKQIITRFRPEQGPTKVCLVKAMVLPVVMYGYESWTVKKAEH